MAANERTGLFNNYKACAGCGKRLPDTYTEDYCPNCKSAKLLHDVKDFIRENDVNEYQVAEYFQIPVRVVKEWIREGRLEYRTNENGASFSMHCQRCGAPVTFGSVCPKCLKLMNGTGKGYGVNTNPSSNERMRFLDKDD